MAILSNVNGKFAVDSTGAIQFSGQTGTSGYVLKSNGNAAPTWVDGSTVIGGPYLPLAGGTLTGATATASGISFTVGGVLTGTTASFNAGATNVVATFTSTDGIAGIALVDSSGNVELSASGNTFQVQPAGGVAALTVSSTNATFEGTVQVNGSNATVINASDPNVTVSDTDTNYRGSMRWLTSSNVLEFFTRYAGTYYTNNLVLDRGNVGIGVSPTFKLDVLSDGSSLRLNSSDANGSYLTWSNNGTANGFIGSGYHLWSSPNNIATSLGIRAQTRLDLGIGASVHMTILSSGNVGIGTTSPGARLHVVSSTPDAAIFDTTSAVYGAMNTFKAQGVIKGASGYNAGSMYFGGEAGTNTIIQSGGQTGIYINNSSRNVGIGTTAPICKLDVKGPNTNNAIIARFYSNEGARGDFIIRNGVGTTPTTYIGTGGGSEELGIGTNNTEAIRLDASQNTIFSGLVKINTGAKSSNPRLYFQHDTLNVNNFIEVDRGTGAMEFYNNGSERMRITSGGILSIGDINPTLAERLVIAAASGSGNVCDISTGTTANTNVGAIVFRNSARNYCGQITVNGATAVTSYLSASDYRLKEDLQDFQGLSLVSNIKVYDYKWKSVDERTYGVMAHELQEILPQAVNGEKDAEEMQSVDYSKVVPLLVKSIQELEARIKILENK